MESGVTTPFSMSTESKLIPLSSSLRIALATENYNKTKKAKIMMWFKDIFFFFFFTTSFSFEFSIRKYPGQGREPRKPQTSLVFML